MERGSVRKAVDCRSAAKGAVKNAAQPMMQNALGVPNVEIEAIFFGGEAFSYKTYSWIAITVNIPATFLATAYYEMLMRDSLKRTGSGYAEHAEGEAGLAKHLSRTGWAMEPGASSVTQSSNDMSNV
ncbi:hypothetical protein P154DRAFT_619374 [Amniculicola lignicola CBS 123094]|uniref:Uncharacterized protein n=1 Tax=Amniculicola lignicola CBS 123094 TaxID=1392246 RepID=A0A6A5WHN6_9PLEO|nr:hypothetical protein P154DRAFT_619374 [Amniculicola lignicola CBS 123094]